MKNISLILNLVLLVAVAVLFYIVLGGQCGTKEAVAVTQAGSHATDQSLSVVYINSDSLLSKYEYFKDMSSGLEGKKAKLEGEYRKRAEGLQKEIEKFQKAAQSMTMNEARAGEEALMQKQQKLYEYQQTLGQQLLEEEGKLNESLYQSISEYLNEYSGTRKYDLVLTYTKGSGVLFANDRLDVTQEILMGLNQKYLQSKGVIPQKEKDSGTEKK